jgi:hypothetical protein
MRLVIRSPGIDISNGDSTATVFEAGVPHAAALRYVPGTFDSFVDGKLDRTTSATTTGAAQVCEFAVGALVRASSPAAYCPAGLLIGLFWQRALTDAELKSISDNPWQIFRSSSDLPPVSALGIALDSTANSGYQAAASTYTFNRTVTGADTFLSIDVSLLSAGQTVTSIVDDYGGANVSAVFVGAQSTVSSVGRVECWRVVAPVAGTKTIQVNLSGSIASAATAVSYTGVHQTSPTEGFNSAQATNVGAADATVSITTVADNCWVHGAIATDDTAITANQTSRNNVTGVGGSGADEDNNGPKTPAGAVTMSYTNVGALATWAIAGYAIRPVAAGGDTTVTCTVADEAEACPSASVSLSTIVTTSIYGETEACPSASISLSTNIAASVAAEVEAGLASSISLSTNVAVTTSNEAEAGLPLIVDSATNVVCSVANENESGIIVAVGISTQVNCVIGNEDEAGLAVAISNGTTVVCGVADEQEVGLGVTITASGGAATGSTPWYQLALRRGKR